jgi:hypothetical protein
VELIVDNIEELRGSIAARKSRSAQLGEHGPHRARIREEESLLRSLESISRICMAPRINHDDDPARGDVLMSLVLTGELGNGEIGNELLKEFQRGYPVECLNALIESTNHHVVSTGAWIASELGSDARPLMNRIVGLLTHPFFQVRFFTLDYILLCAGPEDGDHVYAGLTRLKDEHSGVRWNAMMFVQSLASPVLQSAFGSATDPEIMAGLRLMAAVELGRTEEIAGLLASDSMTLRGFAAAAAAKAAPVNDRPLRVAMTANDSVVRQFAEDVSKRRRR